MSKMRYFNNKFQKALPAPN